MDNKIIFTIIFLLCFLSICSAQETDGLSKKDIEIHNPNISIIDSLILRFIEAEEGKDISFLKNNCSDEFTDLNRYLEFVRNHNMKFKVYDFDNDGEYYKVLRKIVHFDFIQIESYETYNNYDSYSKFDFPECDAIAWVKISYKCDGKYSEETVNAGLDIDIFGPIDYVFIKIENNWKLINIMYAGPG